MNLTRRNFLKRLSGSLAALGILPTVLPEIAPPDPLAKLEALDGFSQTIPFTGDDGMLEAIGLYQPGLIYVNEGGSWHILNDSEQLPYRPVGIAISEYEIATGNFVVLTALGDQTIESILDSSSHYPLPSAPHLCL